MTKVVFFGNEQLAQGLSNPITPVLEQLVANDYNVAAVVTHFDRKEKKKPEIIRAAEKFNIPVWTPQKPMEIYEGLKELNADIGVLSSYGSMIPERIIGLFPRGILNIHPSLLPKYRGSTPIESVILNGDKETGVSVMGLVKQMDAGPIFAQERIELNGNESKSYIYETLAEIGAKLLVDVLPSVVKNTTNGIIQDENQATFCDKLDKTMSKINVVKNTTDEILRQVRAFAGWPKSRIRLLDVDCVITEATSKEAPETQLDIKCKDGKYLIIKRLIPAGRKEMDAASFLNGFLGNRA